MCPIVSYTARKSLACCLIALHWWGFHLTLCHDSLQVCTAASVWVCFKLNSTGSACGSIRKHNTCIVEGYVIYMVLTGFRFKLSCYFTIGNCDFNLICQYHDCCETMVKVKHFEGKCF